jgi:hypothetical protein
MLPEPENLLPPETVCSGSCFDPNPLCLTHFERLFKMWIYRSIIRKNSFAGRKKNCKACFYVCTANVNVLEIMS